ncbi:MAG: hypothetical protein B7C24_08985 [Bacteroidetes bacterium 4572_77]|nr:MAG: hypothetical protein B7C24_08985 [Bacteroidetes bacterium 4572_77]
MKLPMVPYLFLATNTILILRGKSLYPTAKLFGHIYPIARKFRLTKKTKKAALALLSGQKQYQLKLKPKDKDSNYDYVILLIDKDKMQLSDFIIYDFDDNIFSYEIKQFITDTDLSADNFEFDTAKYPNVEVIDMR